MHIFEHENWVPKLCWSRNDEVAGSASFEHRLSKIGIHSFPAGRSALNGLFEAYTVRVRLMAASAT